MALSRPAVIAQVGLANQLSLSLVSVLYSEKLVAIFMVSVLRLNKE